MYIRKANTPHWMAGAGILCVPSLSVAHSEASMDNS